MHVGRDEVPAVGVGLAADIVEFKHLVQSLQGQGRFVVFLGHTLGVRPIQGNEVQQFAGVQHLALNLVAVLNQGDEVFLGAGQGFKDGVVLGLGPFEGSIEGRVDPLEEFNEGFLGGLAAAGIADAQQGFAVAFFNGFLIEFLVGHGLGFGNHIRYGFFRESEGTHGQRHDHCQHERKQFLHTIDFLSYLIEDSAVSSPLDTGIILLSAARVKRKQTERTKHFCFLCVRIAWLFGLGPAAAGLFRGRFLRLLNR